MKGSAFLTSPLSTSVYEGGNGRGKNGKKEDVVKKFP